MSSLLKVERTLAIIKPHAICHRLAIIRRAELAGFHILQERCVRLTVEQAMSLMLHKSNECKSSSEIEIFSSGPMVVLVLARSNAVESWKQLMGPENCSVARESSPTSLRALFGAIDDDAMNAVYGSQTDADVNRELLFFFPNTNLEQNFDIGLLNEYLCAAIYQPLTEALYEMVKTKPNDPLTFLANFMIERNDNKPTTSGTDPRIIQKLKEFAEVNYKQEKIDGPLACGCHLSKTSSPASISTSRCCTKRH